MNRKKLRFRDTRDRKHRRLTRKDVHAAAKRLRNWGRWGKADEIGTLNYGEPGDIVEGHYRWTRGGLRGVDYAGEEVSTGQPLN